MKKNNRLRKAPAIVAATQQPAVVCDDIEQLTFAKFLKCVCDGNYAALTISGSPSANQLFLAWITILSTHYSLIKSKEQASYIKAVSKLEALNLKITVVAALCESLFAWYEPKICECLKKWGYRKQFTETTYLQDIERVLLELGNDRFMFQKLKNEYNAKQLLKKKNGKAPTKESYMRMLYAIEKHRQYRYPPDKITLYEFDMFCNELAEYSELMKAENEKVTRKYRRNAK